MADSSQPAGPPSQLTIPTDPEGDLGISQDPDVEMAISEKPQGMGMDGAGDGDEPVAGTADELQVPRPVETKLPSKKDASLREFMDKMDEYAPIIPDAVTNYYLTKAGLPPPPQTPIRLARLLALATQKFIADIAADAYQYSRIRSSNTSSNNPMGSLGAAAGFPGPGGPGGLGGGAGGGATGQAGKEGGGGQQHTKGGHVLGVQRPGYGGGGQGGGHGRTVLMMEDLGMAVGEYGVNLKRGEFYR